MNSQFKFKPDKIKYLSNVDTLDSTHKKITNDINKKRDDIDDKTQTLIKLKNELEELDNRKNGNFSNYLEIRAKLIENISKLEEEIEQINNYDEETEYYSKRYQILFNYYDLLDGQIESEINDALHEENTFNPNSMTNDINKNDNCDLNTNTNTNTNINTNTNTNTNTDNNSNNKNILTNTQTQKNDIDEWNLDGTQIFNFTKASKLDLLYELSKKKRKEKKNTRKRVKNVESLIKDNNYDIFEFINSKNNNLNITNGLDMINSSKLANLTNPTNSLNPTNLTNTSNHINTTQEYDVYDRAKLYDDYKISFDGYNSKKKHSKICENCNIDKILIYSEGIYACMKCGEVENCIIESEVTNYKEPMVDKPTFPYKRKNHFCEWRLLFTLLIKVICKKNGYFLY
jgi:hypothetical protein